MLEDRAQTLRVNSRLRSCSISLIVMYYADHINKVSDVYTFCFIRNAVQRVQGIGNRNNSQALAKDPKMGVSPRPQSRDRPSWGGMFESFYSGAVTFRRTNDIIRFGYSLQNIIA